MKTLDDYEPYRRRLQNKFPNDFSGRFGMYVAFGSTSPSAEIPKEPDGDTYAGWIRRAEELLSGQVKL